MIILAQLAKEKIFGMSDAKKLHFMHIPKTGGSSLWPFIGSQFKFADICPALYLYNKPPVAWITSEQVFENLLFPKEYSLYKGHLGWTPRNLFPPEAIKTITFLRDPLERMLSQYGHIGRDKIAFPKLSQRWKNFDDFIFDPLLERYLLNQQAQHFCADRCLRDRMPLDLAEFVGIWAFDIDMTQTEMQRLSLERMHECDFVGITEHYDDSFKQLCMQYKWLPPRESARINVTPGRIKRADLSSQTLDRVRELNQLDVTLYQEATTLFADRTRTRVAFEEAILEKIVFDNLPPQETVHFSFIDKIVGGGWHARETLDSGVVCWSSGILSTLVFCMKAKANHFIISFHVITSLLPKLHKKLALSVNARPVPLSCYRHPKENGLIFEGIFSTGGLADDMTVLELTFSVPKVLRPCDIVPSNPDTRELGFACKSVTITSRH
jgi:hypothetical protein